MIKNLGAYLIIYISLIITLSIYSIYYLNKYANYAITKECPTLYESLIITCATHIIGSVVGIIILLMMYRETLRYRRGQFTYISNCFELCAILAFLIHYIGSYVNIAMVYLSGEYASCSDEWAAITPELWGIVKINLYILIYNACIIIIYAIGKFCCCSIGLQINDSDSEYHQQRRHLRNTSPS